MGTNDSNLTVERRPSTEGKPERKKHNHIIMKGKKERLGEREEGRKEGREGGREGGKEEGREGGREGGRKGRRDGGKEQEREKRRERRRKGLPVFTSTNRTLVFIVILHTAVDRKNGTQYYSRSSVI